MSNLTEAASQPREGDRWRERWYGSDPEKGSAIVTERGDLVVYLGGDRETHRLTTAIVAAHNAALTQRPPEQAGAVQRALDALKWANERLRECGKQVDFTLGMCMTLSNSEKRADALDALLSAAPTPLDAGPGEIPAGMGGDNNPCRHCGTEYPRPMRTAANTPPDELARIQLLADVELHLQSVRIFLTKREKMHPCGVDLHDELQARVTEALTPKAPPQTPPDAENSDNG